MIVYMWLTAIRMRWIPTSAAATSGDKTAFRRFGGFCHAMTELFRIFMLFLSTVVILLHYLSIYSPPYMLLRSLARSPQIPCKRLVQMSTQLSNGAANGSSNSAPHGVSLHDLPKSNVFTQNLPPDPKFKTPSESAKTPRADIGPRMVKGALYTYVGPEATEHPELLGVSRSAMRDIGLKEGEENSEEFKQMAAGNKIYWDEGSETGIYSWAQCYGGTFLFVEKTEAMEIMIFT